MRRIQRKCVTLSFFKIYLAVTDLSCGMQVLVPRSRIEPRPPALEAQSPSHWTVAKSQEMCMLMYSVNLSCARASFQLTDAIHRTVTPESSDYFQMYKLTEEIKMK